MFVKQISVFLENIKGSLRALTNLLGENGVDVMAISIADTQNFGILRLVVRGAEIDRAMRLLKDNGYTVRETDVICACVPDKPMGLAQVLNALDEKLSIEYLYSFVRGMDGHALIILRLSDPDLGVALLSERGVRLLAQTEVDAL